MTKRARSDRRLNSKQVAELLRISLEAIPYLRREDGLPFFREGRFIRYTQREVERWRNARLASNHRLVCNLREYFDAIRLTRYCAYEQFRQRLSARLWVEGDDVVWYLKRQRPWNEIKDTVAELIAEHSAKASARCGFCGRRLYGSVCSGVCYPCRIALNRGETPGAVARAPDDAFG